MMNGIYMQPATIGGCDEDGEYELQHIAIPVPALRGVDIEGDHDGAVRELVEAIDDYMESADPPRTEIMVEVTRRVNNALACFRLVEDVK